MADVQEDGNGNIALKRYTTIPKLVKMGDGTSYSFTVHANICLCWVQTKHAPQILAILHHCNCGNSNGSPEFRYANESDVRRWTNRGGS